MEAYEIQDACVNDEMAIYQSEDGAVQLRVEVSGDTVWLTQAQMVELFGRDKSTISRHIKNVFDDGELDEGSVVAFFATTASDGKEYNVEHYNLDVVISVGYRVKSKRGVDFRKWATSVLHKYIMDGYAANIRRLEQLGQIVSVMDRVQGSLEARDVLDVIKSYTSALDLLDDYDHQRISKPKGTSGVYALDYEECRGIIERMRFAKESDLFGVEKDDSFKSSIAVVYQSFGGKDIYPSTEEKAANLLYFVVKNHSFHDGNKRIAATLFLYFLDRNGLLYSDGSKRLSDAALVALTIMIAESKPEEKEAMVSLTMSFLDLG